MVERSGPGGSLYPHPHELARRALLAFLLTFILARVTVFLIMARSIPNMYLFLSSTHVHHLNYGIFLLAAVGAYTLMARPGPTGCRRAAFVYGIAMALTFDEFGMWLHLGGSYWQRASVDATIVVAAVFGLIAYALYDASERLSDVAGPRLRELEQASSP